MIRLKAIGGMLSLFALMITIIPVFILDIIWGILKGIKESVSDKLYHWKQINVDFIDGYRQFWKQLKTGKY